MYKYFIHPGTGNVSRKNTTNGITDQISFKTLSNGEGTITVLTLDIFPNGDDTPIVNTDVTSKAQWDRMVTKLHYRITN